MRGILLYLGLSLLPLGPSWAQAPTAADTLAPGRDIHDLVSAWHLPLLHPHAPRATMRRGNHQLLLVPVPGYSLQTRALVALTASLTYQAPRADVSNLTAQLTATQNQQVLFTTLFLTWDVDNRAQWQGDYRLLRYPQSTFGLGMFPPAYTQPINMTYNYLRLYQSRFWRLHQRLYGGLGYQLDVHWQIASQEGAVPVTAVSGYQRGLVGRAVSAGPAFTLLLDTRLNQLSPVPGGWYLRGLVRPNWRVLGSDTNYERLQLEARHYVGVGQQGNILAFWSYNDFTFNGEAPYLDLPATGWDTYSNVGRGYIQGRFRGRSLLYDETEFRFHLTADQLLGGVLFANVETVPEVNGGYRRVAPAGGLGVRLRLNKHSRANLALDYGFGAGGSHGLFVNLGEVF